ncbi:hypothetical protein WYO_5063 [Methylobacterium sp. GXF4]|uniref:Uncharacterized protein n=1 Tax=Methylobacterium brachiatum TaxID=269660 RepID=A0AAJ1TUB6_9HYPH|nr:MULTISPECIES: hypothetical protein [Methylobacterium]EIZ82423.1 hypothetical protein WYO_5063 [Methylobacterium sp. GXF4]MCB4803343.1 hypothetical protein [Methylobacterium brachiatum]MDQ0544073.1 hypothetical protein [Methylobacterium brachiatum]
MVGSVNRVAAPEGPQRPVAHKVTIPGVAADARGTAGGSAQEGGADAQPDEEAVLPPPERLGYAKLSQISSVLTTLASARTSQRDRAAFALQEAERKLRRLKAEALAAEASGDRKAAARIVQDLAQVAHEIADAARDYAAAGGEPGLMEASLTEVAAGIDPGAALESDASSSERPETAAGARADEPGMAEAPNDAADDLSAASPDPTTDEFDPSRTLPEDEAYPGALLRHEPDDHGDDSVEAHAHELLDEAVTLKQAMARVLRSPPADAETTVPTIPPNPPVETGPARRTGLGALVTRLGARA